VSLLTGDQLAFFAVALILFAASFSAIALNRKHGSAPGETFWLWGMVLLAVSYVGFGSSIWAGRSALVIANIAFPLAYVSLTFQLRFWRTGKLNIPRWVYVASVVYILAFEMAREFAPYMVRTSLAHSIVSILLIYLLWSTIKLYRTNGSNQLLILSFTFVIEFLCAFSRLVLPVLLSHQNLMLQSIFAEPDVLMLIRWVWLVANAMSYIAVMTFVLEKTLDRNEVLQALLKEKRQLLNAMSRVTRNHKDSGTASSLTHELRQPLSALLLMSQNLRADLKDKNLPELLEQADFLCQECERSASIMRELEFVFRPPSKRLETVSLSSVIQNALRVLSPRITAQNIHIAQSGNLDVTVKGEAIQLESVFINLLSNATYALLQVPGTRQIQIHGFIEAGHAIVEVKDNGPGIDPATLSNLGQLYVSDREEGSGIGLWLSYTIVENQHGKIEAHNQVSGGACFRVSLPISDEGDTSSRS
jgi:signal transduction histidine kinase